MRTNLIDFIRENFKMIVAVGSFLLAFYVQSITNTNSITELKKREIAIEERLRMHDAEINALKIDKATYQSTVEQVTMIREDIKELRSDIKELLKKK